MFWVCAGLGCYIVLDVDQQAAASTAGGILDYSLDRLGWPRKKRHSQARGAITHTHIHCFSTLYYSLSLWAEAKMSGQGKRGGKKRGETTKLITGTQCCTRAVLVSWGQDLRKMKRSFEGFFFFLMLKIPLIYLLETERHIRYFAYVLHVVNCTNVRLTNQYRSRFFFSNYACWAWKGKKKKKNHSSKFEMTHQAEAS